jgi:hypothetical protein
VGYAGVYDLGLMGDVDDLAESRIGRAYVRKVVGEDEAALRRGSRSTTPTGSRPGCSSSTAARTAARP